MKKLVVSLGLVLALAACASDPVAPPVAFKHDTAPKIMLDVKKISLADRSGIQPESSPFASNSFSPTITEAVKLWAKDHLQAGGTSGQAVIIVKNASLASQPLQLHEGIDYWFTRQQSLKYIAQAQVSIEASNGGDFATTDASASHAITLPEDATDREKQDAYMTMLNGLMKDLGKNIEAGIQGHMGKLISQTSVPSILAVPEIQPAAGGASPGFSIEVTRDPAP